MSENTIPQHIAIILDGNRRFAKKQRPSLTILEGHTRGWKTLSNIANHAFHRGIKIVSAFAFSTENWNRSQTEIDYIMQLIQQAITQDLKKFQKNNYKFIVSGRLSQLSRELQKSISHAIETTKNNTEGTINICLNYGGRAEILNALKKIVSNNISANLITEQLISENLYAPTLPDPDIIIRTGGELRLSGFLTWQSVYSELFFLPKLWPEFTPEDLDNILMEFNKRKRNFGK